jgi:dTDP-4-amino-4,6-dideoxygalactose transaminase
MLLIVAGTCKQVEKFEASLEAFQEGGNVVAVANGLDVLRLILKAYMELIMRKDEAIVPATTSLFQKDLSIMYHPVLRAKCGTL